MPEGVLLDILLVLLAAKLAAEGAERLGFPAVVAEIVAGVVIGPSALGLVAPSEVLHVLGELGVILLLLEVGMHMDLGELGAVGRASLGVAVCGVAVPFALGAAAASLWGFDANTAVFVGAALTATSVGITARVFGDLRALASVEARTVLGAAVADDVLGLVMLTVVVRVVTGDGVTPVSVGAIVFVAVGFLVVTSVAGAKLARPFFRTVHRGARSAGTLVAVALAFALLFAELASLAKLAPIVGAFVAGLCIARSVQADRIRRELAPVGHLFIPVFFLQIGIATDVTQFARPAVLGLAGVLLATAIVGKMASAAGMLGAPGDRLVIGLGMLPRGEVGLIFAGIGLREGVLGEDLYAALLLVVLATTLMSPPLLRWRMGALQARRPGASQVHTEPSGGWFVVGDGVVDLAADPPGHQALHVILRAARLAAHARPGARLLDWSAALPTGPLRWDDAATTELFDVLRDGNTRSWRLLETAGVLERALPELAEAFDRRRSDPFELDPTQAFRWELVDRLHELLLTDGAAAAVHAQLERPELLLLAALIADAAGDEGVVPTARRLVKRLDLGAAAEQEVALLVGETALLRAAAARTDGLAETSVVQLAAHLATPERARALYLLTLAVEGLSELDRSRIDELHGLVQQVLNDPRLTGREARNLVEGRRAMAAGCTTDRGVAERVSTAPDAFVLAQDGASLARRAGLLEPLPAAGTLRVDVTPADEGWWVDVATRDRPGLLAGITGGLARADLDVAEASVATWGDGAALEAFRVLAATAPQPADLRRVLSAALADPSPSAPVHGADVDFDDDGSPWYTVCSIRADDGPGLLCAFASAFAAANVDVHSARVSTAAGWVADVFELTDRRGGKLDDATKAAVRAAIASGVRTVPRRLGRRPKLVPSVAPRPDGPDRVPTRLGSQEI